MSWDIDILDTPFYYESPKSSYFSIVTIRSEKWEINQNGPELNHDYISYSDIKRFNIDLIRGSGPLISLDHVRIRRPIESAFSWMLYRNPSLFLSSTDKGSSRVTRAISFFFEFFFLFVMVMQCKRSEIRLFLMMKRAFILCEIYENPKCR